MVTSVLNPETIDKYRQVSKGTKQYTYIDKEIQQMLKNGKKHSGMKSVHKLKNWNGNTKPKICMPR